METKSERRERKRRKQREMTKHGHSLQAIVNAVRNRAYDLVANGQADSVLRS